jgi:hypothetical protein
MTAMVSGMLIAAAGLGLLGAVAGAAEPPTDGLVLHLDASRSNLPVAAGDGPLARWPDLSGRGNDVEQPDAALQPTVVSGALDGLPVVRFSGGAVPGWPGRAAGRLLHSHDRGGLAAG